MSEQPREPETGGESEERRSGAERRQEGERRRQDRGVWHVPVLKRLIDRRKGGDRRSGAERRVD